MDGTAALPRFDSVFPRTPLCLFYIQTVQCELLDPESRVGMRLRLHLPETSVFTVKVAGEKESQTAIVPEIFSLSPLLHHFFSFLTTPILSPVIIRDTCIAAMTVTFNIPSM